MKTIAGILRQAAALPNVSSDHIDLLEVIAEAAEAERDDSDPVQFRRDVHLVVGVMQERYGKDAIAVAERIARRLGNMPFARVVISALKRRARAEGRRIP